LWVRIWSRFIWILAVTTKLVHFTTHEFHCRIFCQASSSVSTELLWPFTVGICFLTLCISVSNPLKLILYLMERERLLEGFSLSIHENTSVDSQRLTFGFLGMRCRVNVFNCHLDNDTGNLVTEPLSRNGRPLRFRYNPAFSGTPHFIFM
jgi:hypothetical protein